MARSDFRDLAKAIVRLPDQSTRTKPKPFDTSGIVKRIDGKTAYVKFKGSEEETPVNISVACSVGDDVRVRVDGRKAFIIGNTTAPPTDDKLAKVARTQAVYAGQEAANAALDAKIAQEKANIAEMEATNAASAAESARSVAENVKQYFWYKNDETGYDTEAGAHITEVPQEDFEAHPSGGNILIRSQIMKFRMALNTLAALASSGYQIFDPEDAVNPVAQFLSTGMVLGKETNAHTVYTSNGMKLLYDDKEIGLLDFYYDTMNKRINHVARTNSTEYAGMEAYTGNSGTGSIISRSDITAEANSNEIAYFRVKAKTYGSDQHTIATISATTKDTDDETVQESKLECYVDSNKGAMIKTNGNIIAQNHAEPIGYYCYASNTTNMDSSTSVSSTGASIEIGKGTWIVSYNVRWDGNNAGRREIALYLGNSRVDYSTVRVICNMTGDSYLGMSIPVQITTSYKTATVYAAQNSDSRLEVVSGIVATRIA